MKKILYIFTILFLLSFCISNILGFEVQLNYEKSPANRILFRPYGSNNPEKLTEVPPGNWKLPELKSKIPIYTFFNLGETKRLIIFDQKSTTDGFYNIIYFDANCNRDLRDDPVISAITVRNRRNYARSTFPLIDTFYLINKKQLPYSSRPEIYLYSSHGTATFSKKQIKQSCHITFSMNCYYKGKFTFNNKNWNLIVSDSNVNGLLNDTIKLHDYNFPDPDMIQALYPQGDTIYLKEDEKFTYNDRQILTNKWFLNGKLYNISINSEKCSVSIEEFKGELCELKIPMEVSGLTLNSEDNKHSISVFEATDTVKIPDGRYRFLNYNAVRKDKMGDKWYIQANASNKTPYFTLKKNKTKILKIGEPYNSVIYIPKWSRDNLGRNKNTRLRMEFKICGSAMELVSNLNRFSGNQSNIPISLKNTTRPKEATYTVSKIDGSIVKQGQFEYG
jgi:hypothetical protein